MNRRNFLASLVALPAAVVATLKMKHELDFVPAQSTYIIQKYDLCIDKNKLGKALWQMSKDGRLK